MGPPVLSDPVPEPAAPEPSVWPVARDLYSAYAGGHGRVPALLSTGGDSPPDPFPPRLGAGVGPEDSRSASRSRFPRVSGIETSAPAWLALVEELVALPPRASPF